MIHKFAFKILWKRWLNPFLEKIRVFFLLSSDLLQIFNSITLTDFITLLNSAKI